MAVETTVSIKELINKYGQLVRPSEINVSEFTGIIRRGILIATAEKGANNLVILCLSNAALYAEVIELWKGNFYNNLELWFIGNAKRAGFACDFVRAFGRKEKIRHNPLTFKGLGWNGEAYWVAIANDRSPSLQGELFPNDKSEIIPLNVGDNEIFSLLKKGLGRGNISRLDFYKLKKNQGDQFRQIYPWWLQRTLIQQLREADDISPQNEQLESAS